MTLKYTIFSSFFEHSLSSICLSSLLNALLSANGKAMKTQADVEAGPIWLGNISTFIGSCLFRENICPEEQHWLSSIQLKVLLQDVSLSRAIIYPPLQLERDQLSHPCTRYCWKPFSSAKEEESGDLICSKMMFFLILLYYFAFKLAFTLHVTLTFTSNS